MRPKHSLFSIVAIVCLTLTIGAFPVLAQETSGNTSLNNRTQIRARLKELQDGIDKTLTAEQKLARLDEFKNLPAFERCQLRERNFAARVEYYQFMRDRQSQSYNRIVQNLKRGLDRLKELKASTKELETAIATFEGYTNDIRTLYFDTEAAMEKVAPQICDIQKRDQVDIKNMEKYLTALSSADGGTRKYLRDEVLPLIKAATTPTSTTTTAQ